AGAHCAAAAAVRVLHRRAARLQRGPAEESGEVGDGGVSMRTVEVVEDGGGCSSTDQPPPSSTNLHRPPEPPREGGAPARLARRGAGGRTRDREDRGGAPRARGVRAVGQ